MANVILFAMWIENEIFICVGTLGFLLSIHILYLINVKRSAVRSFTALVNFVTLVNFVQWVLILFQLIYYKYLCIRTDDFYITNVTSIISDIEIALIFVLDIEILRTFSALIPSVTNRTLNMCRNIFVALFVIGPLLSSVLRMLEISPIFRNLSNISVSLFAIIVVIYDNLQNVYLGIIVYRYKLGKLSDMTPEILYRFKKITQLNIAIVSLDWTGLGFAVWYLDTTMISATSTAYYLNLASVISVCFHSLGLVYVLKLMKELTIMKRPKKIVDRAVITTVKLVT
ncbi:hypothetical protein HDV06_006665 [Boothiomyces sp. JEL0866]|nr:hypothetical protein HDV06_006665 [Boothiomyces sp. JEL0866]